MESTEKLEELSMKFIDIEKNKKQGDKGTALWVKDITDPQYQLISNLITKLCDKLTNTETKVKIFRIIKLCLEINVEVLSDIKESTAYPSVLCDFIVENKDESFQSTLLFVFAYCFELNQYQPYITEALITKIFNTLKSLDDEFIFERIISILIDINSIYVDINENLFLNVYHVNENSRVLEEVLLRLFNTEEDKDQLFKILLCLMNILDKEKKNIFYSKDKETFIDITLLKLESTYTEELKLFLLETLKRVTKYKDFYKEMYKVHELTELMEDYTSNDEQSPAIKKISGAILRNLQKNLTKVLLEQQGGEVKDDDDEEEEEEEEGEEEEGEEEEDEEEKKE